MNGEELYQEAEKYYFGKGVAVDYREAARLYSLAVEKSHQLAIHRLAQMYERGIGVSKDERWAAELRHLAEALGHQRRNDAGLPQSMRFGSSLPLSGGAPQNATVPAAQARYLPTATNSPLGPRPFPVAPVNNHLTGIDFEDFAEDFAEDFEKDFTDDFEEDFTYPPSSMPASGPLSMNPRVRSVPRKTAYPLDMKLGTPEELFGSPPPKPFGRRVPPSTQTSAPVPHNPLSSGREDVWQSGATLLVLYDHRPTMDCTASGEHFLDIVKGSKLTLIRDGDRTGWIFCKDEHYREGLVPGNYVQLVSSNEAAPAQVAARSESVSSRVSAASIPSALQALASVDRQISMTEITEHKFLGKGTFGEVYEVFCERFGSTRMALKKLTGELSPVSTEEFKHESEMLMELDHPNIIKAYALCLEGPYGIVMELATHGSLSMVALNKAVYSDARFNWLKRLEIALGSARGLAYLHSQQSKPIVHRDIKGGNILLVGDTMQPKLADFGFSTNATIEITLTVKASVSYAAPEIFTTETKPNEKIDVYAFAIVLWQILTRKEPYKDPERNLYWLVRNIPQSEDNRPPLPRVMNRCQQKLAPLIKHCWAHDPASRPTMDRVVTDLDNMRAEEGRARQARPTVAPKRRGTSHC